MESQNNLHLEKTTGGQLVQLSAYRRAPGFVQLNFENLQGQRFHSLSVPLLRLSHLHCEIIFLCLARIFLAAAHFHCLLFFCCVPLRRICCLCSTPFSLWQTAVRFILYLLFFRLKKPVSSRGFSYMVCSRPLTIWEALFFWPCCNLSGSLSCTRASEVAHCFRCNLMSTE